MLATHITSIFTLASFAFADPGLLLSGIPTVTFFEHTNSHRPVKTSYTGPTLPTQPAQGEPGGHFACTDANFTGSCKYYLESLSECHNYPTELWGAYTSIGPDKSQLCWFFEGEECLGKKVELKFPGTNNLRGLRFDNLVRSWKCWFREYNDWEHK